MKIQDLENNLKDHSHSSQFLEYQCSTQLWSEKVMLKFFQDFIYLFGSERTREQSRGKGRERSRLPCEQEAQPGARSQNPGIMT